MPSRPGLQALGLTGGSGAAAGIQPVAAPRDVFVAPAVAQSVSPALEIGDSVRKIIAGLATAAERRAEKRRARVEAEIENAVRDDETINAAIEKIQDNPDFDERAASLLFRELHEQGHVSGSVPGDALYFQELYGLVTAQQKTRAAVREIDTGVFDLSRGFDEVAQERIADLESAIFDDPVIGTSALAERAARVQFDAAVEDIRDVYANARADFERGQRREATGVLLVQGSDGDGRRGLVDLLQATSLSEQQDIGSEIAAAATEYVYPVGDDPREFVAGVVLSHVDALSAGGKHEEAALLATRALSSIRFDAGAEPGAGGGAFLGDIITGDVGRVVTELRRAAEESEAREVEQRGKDTESLNLRLLGAATSAAHTALRAGGDPYEAATQAARSLAGTEENAPLVGRLGAPDVDAIVVGVAATAADRASRATTADRKADLDALLYLARSDDPDRNAQIRDFGANSPFPEVQRKARELLSAGGEIREEALREAPAARAVTARVAALDRALEGLTGPLAESTNVAIQEALEAESAFRLGPAPEDPQAALLEAQGAFQGLIPRLDAAAQAIRDHQVQRAVTRTQVREALRAEDYVKARELVAAAGPGFDDSFSQQQLDRRAQAEGKAYSVAAGYLLDVALPRARGLGDGEQLSDTDRRAAVNVLNNARADLTELLQSVPTRDLETAAQTFVTPFVTDLLKEQGFGDAAEPPESFPQRRAEKLRSARTEVQYALVSEEPSDFSAQLDLVLTSETGEAPERAAEIATALHSSASVVLRRPGFFTPTPNRGNLAAVPVVAAAALEPSEQLFAHRALVASGQVTLADIAAGQAAVRFWGRDAVAEALRSTFTIEIGRGGSFTRGGLTVERRPESPALIHGSYTFDVPEGSGLALTMSPSDLALGLSPAEHFDFALEKSGASEAEFLRRLGAADRTQAEALIGDGLTRAKLLTR